MLSRMLCALSAKAKSAIAPPKASTIGWPEWTCRASVLPPVLV